MTALWQDREAAVAAAEKLKVYAQPQRLMILSALLDAEHSVGELAAATGIGQPALSQQLAELRRAELVRTRREAKQVWYRLADPAVTQCVRQVEATFGHFAEDATTASAPVRAAPRDTPGPPAGVASFARIL